jgi:ribosome maturation factor RimP
MMFTANTDHGTAAGNSGSNGTGVPALPTTMSRNPPNGSLDAVTFAAVGQLPPGVRPGPTAQVSPSSTMQEVLLRDESFSRGVRGAHSVQAPVMPSGVINGLRKWEGRVVDVEREEFTVELGGDDGSGPLVLADFDRALLGESDSEDISVGDFVYLTLRMVKDRLGRPHPTTSIRRRRLGKWTIRDSEEVSRRAADRFKVFRERLG